MAATIGRRRHRNSNRQDKSLFDGMMKPSEQRRECEAQRQFTEACNPVGAAGAESLLLLLL